MFRIGSAGPGVPTPGYAEGHLFEVADAVVEIRGSFYPASQRRDSFTA
jgi:hypothetical protein